MRTIDSSATPGRVAIVGCGLMGSALARTFAANDHIVAAWNRTHSRAEALADYGVRAERSIEKAIGTADLVVACTTTYDVLTASIAGCPDWSGKTLVNLTSGTPAEAETMQRWVGDRGGSYLDGSIASYPQDIGSSDAVICYSGPTATWNECRQILGCLAGTTRHISEHVTSANLMLAWWGSFLTCCLAAYVESAAYAHSEGVSTTELRELTPLVFDLLHHALPEIATALDTGRHETDQATIDTFLDGTRAGLAVMNAAGHDARLLGAALENLTAASEIGLGNLGLSAQVAVLGRRGGDRTHRHATPRPTPDHKE
ncbi:NAD(P)-dependent oxidoreductase [Nocardia sp. NPDC004582]